MRGFAVAAVLGTVLLAGAAQAAEEGLPPFKKVQWSFGGPFGTYDRASAQRGFQVWNEVCSSCHSMKLMSYRNLTGIGLSDGQITRDRGEQDRAWRAERPGRADHAAGFAERSFRLALSERKGLARGQ